MTSQHPHDAYSRSRPVNAPIQTQNLRNNSRFSWTKTPVQAQQQFPSRSDYGSPTTTIDESPLSASTVGPMTHPSEQTSTAASSSPYLQEEKTAPVVPQRQVHPAHFAPYAEPLPNQVQIQQPHGAPYGQRDIPQQQYQQQHYQPQQPQQHQFPPQPQSQPLPPPSQYVPPPESRPRPATQWPSAHNTTTNTNTNSNNYNPPHSPQISLDNKPPPTPRTPSYTPHSPFGPNTPTHHPPPNIAAHLPGQIPHPNASARPTFSSALLTPDSLCCHACFSPCTLYSLTSYRLAQKAARRDPTNLLDHSACDGKAWLYGLTCGLCGLLACLQRGKVRRGYGIEGGGLVGDWVRGCCCAPCALSQGEREVRGREEKWRLNEGPSLGYQMQGADGGMRYDPPPPPPPPPKK